ncbi:MAG: hypothetical protein HY671_08615 [Chloroflexi bacterium]|nr:hypothetical protein [Chloroflexota bacterium]
MPETPQRGRTGRPDFRHRRGHRRERPRAVASAQGQAAQVSMTPKPAPAPAFKHAEPDYSYVMKDLKNIGIIVGGIVVVYLVLLFTWK